MLWAFTRAPPATELPRGLMDTNSSLVAIAAFAIQTTMVFAGNSRLFGLLKPGSGWYTNVEMAERYASLVTPARYAFAIWGIIYTWEMVAMAYLVSAKEVATAQGWNLSLWVAANGFQALWAPLFATEKLGASGVALSGIAISLILLGNSMRAAAGLSYWLVAAPVWLHAGRHCQQIQTLRHPAHCTC